MIRAAFALPLILALLLPSVLAQSPKEQKAEVKKSDAIASQDHPDDASAQLQATIDQYVAAYSTGQVDQVMSFWVEDADFVDIRGRFHEGRDLISALFRRGFADNPGRTIQLNSASRKFLSPEVAVDDGTLELTSADGAKSVGRYTVVWTKVDGKWLIRSARDIPIAVEPESAPQQPSPLEELEWLIGNWEAKSDEDQITLNCQWALDKSFLRQDYHVKSAEEEFRVVAFIGYDPVESRFRTWFFDSRGGFGGGTWMRIDNVYHTTNVTVLPDGQIGTAVMTWERTGENTVTWRSTERMVGGEPLPESAQTYTRVN